MEAVPVVLHLIDELMLGGAQTHLLTTLREWSKERRYRHVVVCLFRDGAVGDQIRRLGFEVINLNLSEAISTQRYLYVHSEIYKTIRSFRPEVVEAHLTFSRI